MRKLLAVTSFCIPLACSTSLYAHEHGSLEAHEHGKLAINVALTDNVLEIEVDGPAASITGFEYVPTSEADKKIALSAKQQLTDPLTLFAMASGAECEVTTKEVTGAVFGDKEQAEQHEHAATKQTKEEHHHSDVEAHYSFSCKQPNELTALDFANFFKTFPLTKQINLQYVGAKGQQGATLTTTNSQFKLSQ